MATRQGNSGVENSGHSGSDDTLVEVLKLLVQEGQALKVEVGAIKVEVGAIRVQMAEMMGVLQALKTKVEANAIVNPGGIETTLPPPGPVETVITLPPPGPGVSRLAPTPGGTALYEVFQFNEGNNPQGRLFENPQLKDQLHLLEERLRVVENSKTRAKDAYDLCLVPDVVIPPKFKVPDFDKYCGTSCPSDHLTMYARKMTAYAYDDKVLIHYFQESLTGASLSWYMQLQSSDIHSWKDLSEAFLKQYEYNMDLAPDRTRLLQMVKKDNESFKEYAQRWRSIAAQVKPTLTEKEMVCVFMETLPPLYYDRLVGSVSSNFSGMITIGERIEAGIRRGRISCKPADASNASGFSTKQVGEIDGIINQGKSSRYDPIPVSYTDLCSYLIDHNWISPRKMKPVQPPFPKKYNPEATCEFHGGAIGHSAENCHPLKQLVQGLIDTKQLTFSEDGEVSLIDLD